jgi:hypothetical protein
MLNVFVLNVVAPCEQRQFKTGRSDRGKTIGKDISFVGINFVEKIPFYLIFSSYKWQW